MEQETLYAAAKWDMLKALEKSSKSPSELAEMSNTSVSNVSQSLRFLELAGIVKSIRISNRDKGQPRVNYSLSGNAAYLIVTAKDFVQKKQINLDDYKKAILRIWFYENEQIQPFLERAFQNLQEDLQNIKGVFFDTTSISDINIAVLMKNNVKKTFKEFSQKINGISRKIKYKIIEDSDAKKTDSQYYSIYNPQIGNGGDK